MNPIINFGDKKVVLFSDEITPTEERPAIVTKILSMIIGNTPVDLRYDLNKNGIIDTGDGTLAFKGIPIQKKIIKYLICSNNETQQYFIDKSISLEKIKKDINNGLNKYNPYVYYEIYNPEILFDSISSSFTGNSLRTIGESIIESTNPKINLLIWIVPYKSGTTQSQLPKGIFTINNIFWKGIDSDAKTESEIIEQIVSHESGHTLNLNDYFLRPDLHSDKRCYMNYIGKGSEIGYGFCDSCKIKIKESLNLMEI